MAEPLTLLIIGLVFVLAGCVKGVVGFGLPSVSLSLLALSLGIQEAVTLFLAPTIVTNIWQALSGGHGGALLRRFWSLLLTTNLTVWIGALAYNRVDVRLITMTLGVVLVVHSLLNLTRTQMTIATHQQGWAGGLTGGVGGLLGGMTGSFLVPGVLYLKATGLPRDPLVQATGILFASSTTMLALALGHQRILTVDLGLLSLAAVFPAIIGMRLGQRIRAGLSETRFRRVFFLVMLILGCYMMFRSL
ncbi:MAG: sulfite exporter TauE/SafE family protein [Magnetococcales bacterium]|nr:sulfite exporter TauE/SafE family protein [Magnetococcales bacterium]